MRKSIQNPVSSKLEDLICIDLDEVSSLVWNKDSLFSSYKHFIFNFPTNIKANFN